MKLHTSLSQPDPSNEIKPNSRRYLTSPEPLCNPNNYPPSPAELYVKYRAQALFHGCIRTDLSPETPTSITVPTILPLEAHMSLAERMDKWRQKEVNKIYKKHKYSYAYGVTPPSPATSPMSYPTSFFPMPQRMRTSDLQPSARTVKKDRPTTSESQSKAKTFSVV